MTPEEQAVIDAAIVWRSARTAGDVQAGESAVWDATDALMATRDRCTCDPLLKMYCERQGCLGGSGLTEWHPATFADVLAGDRIKLGQDEATVLRCNLGTWHADTSDAWRPRAWGHTELRMELDVVPGLKQYPPGTACEILCTPERLSVLRMGQAFPLSVVLSRPEILEEIPRLGRGMDPL